MIKFGAGRSPSVCQALWLVLFGGREKLLFWKRALDGGRLGETARHRLGYPCGYKYSSSSGKINFGPRRSPAFLFVVLAIGNLCYRDGLLAATVSCILSTREEIAVAANALIDLQVQIILEDVAYFLAVIANVRVAAEILAMVAKQTSLICSPC